METWGLNNFENDGASDFAADILEGDIVIFERKSHLKRYKNNAAHKLRGIVEEILYSFKL